MRRRGCSQSNRHLGGHRSDRIASTGSNCPKAEEKSLGKVDDEITPELTQWIAQQHVFFVATAPLAAGGLVNCSPKGLDTLRVLGPRSVAYLDLTGSGIETVAHPRENGRIVLMFCAFEGPPKILRLHGRGTVVTPADPAFADLR